MTPRALALRKRSETVGTRYREVEGHLLVPSSFVVPRAAPWPRATWDLRLGLRVNQIRSRHDYVRGRPERWLQASEGRAMQRQCLAMEMNRGWLQARRDFVCDWWFRSPSRARPADGFRRSFVHSGNRQCEITQ